jgi:hypothetical protein
MIRSNDLGNAAGFALNVGGADKFDRSVAAIFSLNFITSEVEGVTIE